LYLTTRFFLASELREKRPHYILGSFAYPDGVAATLLARWLGVPAFIKVHGSDINLMADGGPRGWQIRWALRRANGVIAVSRALVDRVTDLGASPTDILLLYNAIDRERFMPRDRQTCRQRLQLPEKRHSVLYVGNLKREKGVMDLAEAFTQLAVDEPDLDLEIVGTGPAGRELGAWVTAKGLGERVHLRGARPHVEIAEWLGACDVLCLPSYAEGVPNVILEAMASGRPVVSTQVGGVAEILSERAGKLVEPGEPQALASAIREVLSLEWPAEELSRTLVAPNWPENARLLSQFIEDRCNRIRPGN
jgi:glycosyltransferase involved in cell wall biosynthesis